MLTSGFSSMLILFTKKGGGFYCFLISHLSASKVGQHLFALICNMKNNLYFDVKSNIARVIVHTYKT